ncbi:hypothetical protein [Enterococcus sp. S22(2020)]|nr:hypothetical protein [Enterococcus sp. S22(2020)]
MNYLEVKNQLGLNNLVSKKTVIPTYMSIPSAAIYLMINKMISEE